MKKSDLTCSNCHAGFERIEFAGRKGKRGEYLCPICDAVLEVLDGSKNIEYRLTVPTVPHHHFRAS
jgi:hypothetical protein